MAVSHVVVLFCTTAGQNAENLGSDEEQIVSFVYLLYDITNNKVVCLQQHYVRPTKDDASNENVLTEECKAQTDLPEDDIKNGQPLEHVLDEFDRFLSSKEVHPDHGGRPFCFCTDGQLHLRLCIHPEASRKGIELNSYFNTFFDLRKEFKKYYKTNNINCIKDMLDCFRYLHFRLVCEVAKKFMTSPSIPSADTLKKFPLLKDLGLEGDQSVEYGVRQAQEMASIIQRLINDGHEFLEPEIIKDRLEPGICTKNDYVDDDTVIRARGLPWQSSDQDIARFFQGLNVARGGVALCLSQQGRRNGEALIRFESKEHRDMALRKHKHHLGQRYIEVYKATGKDFVNVAGGNNSEAQQFLSRHNGTGNQVIVRMRGLPYSATPEQVLEFFRSGENSVEVLDGEEGILFVHQADGRATGDAFVLFPNDEDANKALSKHRECIGSRYIELFKSTTAEVQQVLNRSMDPRNPAEAEPQLPPLIPQLPQAPIMLPQQLITSGTHRDCIRLRGLPYEASVTDILTFLGEHSRNIVFQGVHMVYNAQGTPSGEAFIQMDSEQSAESAGINKHKKFMFIGNKKRYIEVLQCSGEDMNLVLTNGVQMPSSSSILPSMAPPAAATPQILPAQRPLISPGGTMVPTVPPAAAAPTPYGAGGMGAVIPYGQMAQMAAAYQPSSLLAVSQASQMAGALLPPTMTHIQPRPAVHPTSPAYQPILYWYPSPPVSPQSTYYVHASPTTVILKGLPPHASLTDILAFLEGVYEMPPDVQLLKGPDGRPAGEAYITFGSRVEAERAVTERNRKMIGNRFVEMHMA